jgi:hypothetical protein
MRGISMASGTGIPNRDCFLDAKQDEEWSVSNFIKELQKESFSGSAHPSMLRAFLCPFCGSAHVFPKSVRPVQACRFGIFCECGNVFSVHAVLGLPVSYLLWPDIATLADYICRAGTHYLNDEEYGRLAFAVGL